MTALAFACTVSDQVALLRLIVRLSISSRRYRILHREKRRTYSLVRVCYNDLHSALENSLARAFLTHTLLCAAWCNGSLTGG